MRTLFLVGTLLAKGWLACHAWYEYITQSVSRFTRHMIHYFEDPTWYLLHSGIPVYSGHSVYLPEAVWQMKGLELRRMTTDTMDASAATCGASAAVAFASSAATYGRYAVAWLSATLLVRSENDKACAEEYEMDSFLEHLRILMSSTDSICVHDLYMAWCIHTQRWISTTTGSAASTTGACTTGSAASTTGSAASTTGSAASTTGACTHRVAIRYYNEEGEEHTVEVTSSMAPSHRVPCRRVDSKKRELLSPTT